MSEVDANAAADPAKVVGKLFEEGHGGIDQALKDGKGWTEEELLAYAKTIDDNHPMFAESVEDMDPAMVEALQSIKYEDKDPYELAEQAKNHGNSLFSFGKKNPAQYQNAITSYNEAEVWARKAPDEEKTRTLLSQIYNNRALAHLLIKNYRSCREDCDRALKHAPGNVKAIYRKAKACHGLKQADEAINLCDEGLALDEANKELQELRKQAMQCLDVVARRERERQDAQRRREEARRRGLREAWGLCRARGVRLGEAHYAGGQDRRQAEALPREEEGVGLWPLLLLYPQHQVNDFVERAAETEMLALLLAEVMPEEGPPAPWDRQEEYRCSNVEVYFQARGSDVLSSEEEYVRAAERFAALVGMTEEEGARDKAEAELDEMNVWKDYGEYWVHVHPGCTLLEVLQHKDYVVPATTPALHVFARSSRAHATFRERNRGRIRRLQPTQLPH